MHINIIPEVSHHAFILNVRHAFPYLEGKSTVPSRFSKGHATSKGFVPLSDVDAQFGRQNIHCSSRTNEIGLSVGKGCHILCMFFF